MMHLSLKIKIFCLNFYSNDDWNLLLVVKKSQQKPQKQFKVSSLPIYIGLACDNYVGRSAFNFYAVIIVVSVSVPFLK